MTKEYYQKSNKKIKDITNKIVKEFHPEKIILFGSYAWGKPHKDSDIDLFVIKDTKLPRRKRQINIRKLFLDFEMPADVLCYTNSEIRDRLKKNDFFVNKIINSGKVLYEEKI